MPFIRACELGRILCVRFLVRARKVTRPWVREPTAFDLGLSEIFDLNNMVHDGIDKIATLLLPLYIGIQSTEISIGLRF